MTSTEDVCSICHNVVTTGAPDTYCVPECNHRFHSNCIIPWFRASNGTCPNCRMGITGGGLAGMHTIKQVVQLWKYLARRKDCPSAVKRKCEQIRKAKDEEKEAKRKITLFLKELRHVRDTWLSLRRKKWRSGMKVQRLERQLAFLPPQPIMRYLLPTPPP